MEGWIPEGPLASDVPAVTHTSGITERVETRQAAQTFQLTGFPACDLRSQAKYLSISCRAPCRARRPVLRGDRGKRGLAYVVAAMNYAKRLGGSFVVTELLLPERSWRRERS